VWEEGGWFLPHDAVLYPTAGCLSVRLSVASGRCSVKTAKHIAQTAPRGRPGILVYLVATANIIGHRDTSTKTYLLTS